MKCNILFKKTFLIILLFGITSTISGQAILPFSYDGGNPTTAIQGLTQSGLGSDYSSSPKMKFDTSGDYLILNFSGVPGTLSFKIEWNGGSTSLTRFPGDFRLQESADGITYTLVQLYNSTTGTVLANTSTVTETFTTLLTGSRFLKWVYVTKSTGNIGIGALALTTGINPVLNVSGTSLSGFSYISGSGPSAEQSFTVSGSNLYNNIIITPPADYEISKGTGASFIATNPVTLNQSNGIVNTTTIFTRLKSGLTVGNYNENISVTTLNGNSISVNCNGNVTASPTISLFDVTDPTLSTVLGFPVSQTLNVSGVNLGIDMGLAISGSDAGLFSLSQYSLKQTGGTVPNTFITITYLPNVIGSNSATLTMSSIGAMPVIRTLYGISSVATDINTPNATSLIVTVENGNVVFMSKVGETLEIYNSIGQKLIQKLTVEGINTIPVSTHGVLIIKVGAKTAKVIM